MRDLEKMKATFEVFHEAIYIVDTKRKILYFNPVASEVSGFTREEMEGSFCFNNILNHVDEAGKKLCFDGCPLLESVRKGINTDNYVYLHHRYGHRIRVHVRSTPIFEDGKVVGAIEVFVDETQKNSVLDELLFQKHLALIDPLTGLFNRRFLDERFPSIMMDNGKEGKLGVLFLDLDNFKSMNDTHGHLAGDEVLRNISRTLQYNLKSHDYVVRYGGEEIVIFLKDVHNEELFIVAEKLRLLVEYTNVRSKHLNLSTTISIGATMMKPDESLQDAIDRADKAMYQAKQNGKIKQN